MSVDKKSETIKMVVHISHLTPTHRKQEFYVSFKRTGLHKHFTALGFHSAQLCHVILNTNALYTITNQYSPRLLSTVNSHNLNLDPYSAID